MAKLNVYSNDAVEWFIAADLGDLAQQVSAHRCMTGESTEQFEEWSVEPGDADLRIWLDPETWEVSAPYLGAILVVGTCDTWAEAYGRGFLGSSEY